ncbi:MAG: sigma-54 dependent transcriptional regulator [Planctomycetota bacterium]|nr:sigma-54 dependent transcriptional regulator [Planctomycetota bacterium]
MTTALIVSPCEDLRANLGEQVRSLTGGDIVLVERPADALRHLVGRSDLIVFVDCRQKALEQEVFELLSQLERVADAIHAKTIGITDRGYARSLWGIVDRTVAEHLKLPLAPGALAQVFVPRDGGHDRSGGCLILRAMEVDGLKIATYTQALFPILDQLERVAKHDITLLFTGETGTGKSYLAQLVHQMSNRRLGPFFATACGALPPDLIESELFGHVRGAFTTAVRSSEGRFEAAKGGTLLLDEIDALGQKEQSRLLHVIETGKYEPVGSIETRIADVRLIVASNVDLRELAERNQFRMDLYYRLNVLEFHLPPLRERPHDIIPLASGWIDEICSKHRVHVTEMDAGFFELLKQYHWPGNLRELQNQLRRAVLFSTDGVLTPDSLALNMNGSKQPNGNGSLTRPAEWNLNRRLAYSEREFVQETLRAHNNNRAASARALGISRSALYKKLNRLGLLSFGNGSSEDTQEPQLTAGVRIVADDASIPEASGNGNGSQAEVRHHAAS